MNDERIMVGARRGWTAALLCALVACGDSSSNDSSDDPSEDSAIPSSDAGDDTVLGGDTGGDTATPEGFAMLVDIKPSGSSSPGQFVVAGKHTFFVADDGKHGRELWVTDGTTAGTHLVKDIVPGSDGPSFRFAKLAVMGERIVFVVGTALWVSDGTEAGTQQVKAAGTGDFYAATPSHVYFNATDATLGVEMWTTDGTSAGTHVVLDASPGVADSDLRVATVFGDRLLFHAFQKDPASGVYNIDYVYSTSGAVGDAIPLTPKSGLGAASSFVNGIAFGDRALFMFNTAAAGDELWVTDGTPAGTKLLKDTFPGAAGGFPSAMSVFGTKVLFFAYDGTNASSRFLWETDGTAGGTKVVAQADLYPLHLRMTPNGAKFVFPGQQPRSGGLPLPETAGLWETDGTAAGTRLISNAALPTSWTSSTEEHPPIVTLGDKIVFLGSSPDAGTEPWVSDETSAGTMRLQDVFPGKAGSTTLGSGIVTLGAKAYFVLLPASGDSRLYESDGTASGTRAIAPPGASADAKNTVVEEPVRMGSMLLFGANFDGRGYELYKL